MRRRLWAATLVPVLVGAMVQVVVFASPAAAAVPSDPNPLIEESCGLELTLVLDASGSVQSSQAVGDVRDAGEALLTALGNTNSTARVLQFASLSEQLAARTQIDDASLADGGPLGEALQDYYAPIPPRPDNVNIYSYDGSGNAQSSDNYRQSNGSNQYTNWDQSLGDAREPGSELVVYVTDGDPTAFDFDRSGDPFDSGPPPDVAVNTNRSNANDLTMDRAVQAANQIKSDDTRMLAVGVGSALNNSASRGRLQQIAGPQVVRDAELGTVDSLNEIDVALVTEFENLAAFMRSLVLELCSPSLTVRKLAQTAEDATYTPQQGRPITVTPTVPGGDGFSWILPASASGPSATVPTNENGFAQFQWEPDPPEEDSTATVSEATDPDYVPGRPDGDDYRCELRNEDGDVRVVEDDFADPDNPSFELDPIGQEIVTCTLYNSFDYDPVIALEKVNSPTEVRGDLTPPATVTSAYSVTNPGNTPLANVSVTDDRCGPVAPELAGGVNVGDENRDGLLDPGETWEFTCTQPVSVSRSTTLGGMNFINNAEVGGTAPNGERVTATDFDDVDVFTPAISLTKTVNGGETATITEGQDAAYEYVVTNTGNTPLGSVDLDDDTPPCEEPTLVDDGDGDATLAIDESWTYACTAQPDTDVVNTADVTATPLNPVTDDPFVGPNPAVSDEDTAQVTVVSAEIQLTKSVDPDVVLLAPGADPPAESVTYTFEAENNGNAPLTRPGTASPTDPGWVDDPHCDDPAEFAGGDTDGDELLDIDETWTFTCTGSIDAPTVNIADIAAVPTDADGTPIPDAPEVTDQAQAYVEVVQPDIGVTKTALVPVVLDPDAEAVDGPDTPDPRPAEYRYEVTNPGDVPLGLDPAPADDKCGPLDYVEGDIDDSGLLDPGEVWVYTCTTTLERQDGVFTGDRSAVVDNTVTVTGVPYFDGGFVTGKTVSDTDTATVVVIEPGLNLTKSVSPEVTRDGNAVTYTVEVANTGDTGLVLSELSDDTCSPLQYDSGDADEDGVLDGANSTAETWTFTCTRVVNEPDPPDDTLVNTASVTGVDPLGNSYESEDTATVRFITPAIEVTKTPNYLLVPAGTDVTYDFEVRNVGVSDIPAEDVLAQVNLRDVARPGLPACRRPMLVAKDGGNQDDLLERDPAEVWRYRCIEGLDQQTTNVALVAGVGGVPVGLRFLVEDFDVAQVGVFHPSLDVQKSADPVRLTGSGEVTYTYVVTNTGDVPLAGVADRIEDDTCSPVEYVSGDRDGDGLLDTPDSIFEDEADETWRFTCTTTIDETTTNTVLVSGSPSGPHGDPLCGPDAAPGLVDVPCDVDSRDRAVVHVVPPPPKGPGGPGSSVGGIGDVVGPGGLPDTGAPAGLLALLWLGAGLLLAGTGLLAESHRRGTGGAAAAAAPAPG